MLLWYIINASNTSTSRSSSQPSAPLIPSRHSSAPETMDQQDPCRCRLTLSPSFIRRLPATGSYHASAVPIARMKLMIAHPVFDHSTGQEKG